jgi:hypothetical protein
VIALLAAEQPLDLAAGRNALDGEFIELQRTGDFGRRTRRQAMT